MNFFLISGKPDFPLNSNFCNRLYLVWFPEFFFLLSFSSLVSVKHEIALLNLDVSKKSYPKCLLGHE